MRQRNRSVSALACSRTAPHTAGRSTRSAAPRVGTTRAQYTAGLARPPGAGASPAELPPERLHHGLAQRASMDGIEAGRSTSTGLRVPWTPPASTIKRCRYSRRRLRSCLTPRRRGTAPATARPPTRGVAQCIDLAYSAQPVPLIATELRTRRSPRQRRSVHLRYRRTCPLIRRSPAVIAASHLSSPPASRSTTRVAVSTIHPAAARTAARRARLSAAVESTGPQAAAVARGSCLVQRARAAARKLRCRSSPAATGRSTARTATRTIADRLPRADRVDIRAIHETPGEVPAPSVQPSIGRRQDATPADASTARVLVPTAGTHADCH